jgi:hypothetical protein
MGKTYRDVIVHPRSVSYKSDHSRGFAREKDRHSHHSHRNSNIGCDETSYVPFNKDFKREAVFSYSASQQRSNIPNDPSRDLETFFYYTEWVHGSLKENLNNQLQKGIKDGIFTHDDINYMKQTLKQIERRGIARRFVGHDKFSEKTAAEDCS